MASILIQGVDFHYDNPYNDVFQDLSLVLDTEWRTGLVGRNGQGKSTLLKLIAGHLDPGAGTIDVHRPAVYFPAACDDSAQTLDVVKDAIAPFRIWERDMQALLDSDDSDDLARYAEVQERYQSAGGYQVSANIEREFAGLSLDKSLLERPFGTLSGGEQTRALIAALFTIDGYFPLIDEPTNHLDITGRRQLSEYLATKSGFLLVSHDRYFLDAAVDHVVSINRQDILITHGNYSAWKQHMERMELHEERTRANIEREVRHLKKAAAQRRQGAASRERDKHRNDPADGGAAMIDTGHIGRTAAKQMKKALVFERRIARQLEEKQSLLQNKEKQRQLKIQTDGTRQQVLTIQNLYAGYDQPIIDNLSLTLGRGERIAIVGPNGSGKSTLFKVVSGELTPLGGVVSRPGFVRFSQAFQHPLWQRGLLREYLHSAALDETRFRQILGSFGVRGDVFDRPLETFSQGQLKKVDLCRSMMSEADFLMWDEPMNYVDVFSREQIETAIMEYEPTLLFIDHDQYFVNNVATDVVELGR